MTALMRAAADLASIRLRAAETARTRGWNDIADMQLASARHWINEYHRLRCEAARGEGA